MPRRLTERVCEECGASYMPACLEQRTCGMFCSTLIRKGGGKRAVANEPLTRERAWLREVRAKRSAARRVERDKAYQRTRVLDGRNRERMLRRRAAAKGLAVAEYEAERARVEAARLKRQRERERERQLPVLVKCVVCGSEFDKRGTKRVQCGSAECKRRYASIAASRSIMRRYYADPAFRDEMQSQVHARRAKKLGLGSMRITIAYLLERDQWRCGICGRPIRRREDASLDHVVPLARGGSHSLENVQAAHRTCNHRKGARGGGEQLRLIG